MVGVLLLLNVAFALWMVFGAPRSQVVAVPTTVPGIEPLVLWSEHSRRPGTQRANPAITTLKEQPEQPEAVAAPSPDTAPSRDRDPAPPADRESSVDSGAPVPGGDGPSAVAARCRAVGPYTSRDRAASAAKTLLDRGMVAGITEESAVGTRYWVYLPPFVSRSAAFQGERELRAHGIEDIQVLAGDTKENAISLGLYREPAAAERRLDQLRALGYAPQMEAVEHRRSTFWIEVPMGDGAAFPADWWEALMSPGLRLEIRPCATPPVD